MWKSEPKLGEKGTRQIGKNRSRRGRIIKRWMQRESSAGKGRKKEVSYLNIRASEEEREGQWERREGSA